MKRWTVGALLSVLIACGDDEPRASFVYTDDDASDGSSDVDDDGGGTEDGGGRERKFYARFCRDTIGMGLCTEAELEPALECYNEACHPQYEECKHVCSAYIECLDACDCADRPCVVSCEPTRECVDCRNLVDCDPVKRCEPLLPACLHANPPERSCAELALCCQDLRNSARDLCEETVAVDDVGQCSGLHLLFCTQPD